MKHYFTVTEANQQLGDLRALFERVMQLRAQLKTLYQRLDRAGHAPREDDLKGPAGEERDDEEKLSPEVTRDLSWFRGLVETLREQVDGIQGTGCLIKDIEVGLVDWPAMHAGREVLLCWRYGEPEVGFWHELHAGFRGRRPVAELED